MNKAIFLDNQVLLGAPSVKIWHRPGQMAILNTQRGGVSVVPEQYATLWEALRHPAELSSLPLGAGPDARQMLTNWCQVGLVNIGGKTMNAHSREPLWRLCCWGMLGQQLKQGILAEALPALPREAATGRTLSLEEFAGQQCGHLLCEWAASSVEHIEAWQQWRQKSGLDGAQSWVLHWVPTPESSACLGAWAGECSPLSKNLEILAYCRPEDFDACKKPIGQLMKRGLACMPVGVLHDAKDWDKWLDITYKWRFRTVGVSCRPWLSGEIWDRQELLQNAVEAIVRIVKERAGQRMIKRVHPLEKCLALLDGSFNSADRRAFLSENGNVYVPAVAAPAMCGRCWAKHFCEALEMEHNSARCWFRKRLFEELVWCVGSENCGCCGQ